MQNGSEGELGKYPSAADIVTGIAPTIPRVRSAHVNEIINTFVVSFMPRFLPRRRTIRQKVFPRMMNNVTIAIPHERMILLMNGVDIV